MLVSSIEYQESRKLVFSIKHLVTSDYYSNL